MTPATAAPSPSVPQRFAAFQGTRFFGALDGLRCLSILMVIWHHAGGQRPGMLGRGQLGVALFFAISGFLITTLLLREREARGQISLRGFYYRRTLRIFPLYYAVIAAYTVLVALVEKGSQPGQEFVRNLPYFLSYTSNWFVELEPSERVILYFAWSLATEEQFYLVWPGVVRYMRPFAGPAAFMVTLLAIDVGLELAAAAGMVDGELLVVRIATSVAAPICLGCLGATLVHRPRGFALAWRWIGARWCAPAAAAATIASLALDVPMMARYLAMSWLVLAVCIREDHALAPVLGNRVVRHVGTISYGMYLLHMLALNAAARVVPAGSDLALFAATAGLSVILATLSFRYLERPFLRLKRRVRGAPSGGAAAVVGEEQLARV